MKGCNGPALHARVGPSIKVGSDTKEWPEARKRPDPQVGLKPDRFATIGLPSMSGLPAAWTIYQKPYFFETPAFLTLVPFDNPDGATQARCSSPLAADGSAILRATTMISISSRSSDLLPQFPAVPPHMLSTDMPAR